MTGLFDWLSPSWSLRAYFWLTLVLTAAVMLFVHRMMNSPFGMGLVSLRESIRFSIGMGINRRVAFIMATAVSGLIAGLAGGLYATFYHGITPSFMGLGPMGLLVIMVVVGGLGTVRGPIIGAFVVTMLSELLRDTVMWRLVVQGALLLIVLAFWPAGLDGLFERGFDRVRAWMNAGQDEGRPGVPAAAVAEGSTDQAAGRVAAAAVSRPGAARRPDRRRRGGARPAHEEGRQVQGVAQRRPAGPSRAARREDRRTTRRGVAPTPETPREGVGRA